MPFFVFCLFFVLLFLNDLHCKTVNKACILVYQRQIQNPVKHLRWMYHFAKIVNGCQPLISFERHPSLDV